MLNLKNKFLFIISLIFIAQNVNCSEQEIKTDKEKIELNKKLDQAITTNVDIKIIEELLKNGASPNPNHDPEFNTMPLINAVSSGRLDIIKLLLKYKANINATNKFRYNALHRAILKKNYKIAKYLVKKGIYINCPEDINNFIHKSKSNQQIQKIVFLLTHWNSFLKLVDNVRMNRNINIQNNLQILPKEIANMVYEYSYIEKPSFEKFKKIYLKWSNKYDGENTENFLDIYSKYI